MSSRPVRPRLAGVKLRWFRRVIDVVCGGATDVGSVHPLNEDSMLTERPIFAVADGMGGVPAGGQASELAIAELRRCAGARSTTTESVLDAVFRANQAILNAAHNDAGKQGMGTTVVGLALVEDGSGEQWLAFNVGDSRLYRLAGSTFEQITVDHSEVEELVASGVLAAADRAAHPLAHVITRTLGSTPPPDADCWLMHPVRGERFLLCSDGLSGHLTDDDIQRLLGAGAGPEETARQLVDAALRAGSDDNVTAVVVEIPGTVDETATTARRRPMARS
jgi:protein phosphatase